MRSDAKPAKCSRKSISIVPRSGMRDRLQRRDRSKQAYKPVEIEIYGEIAALLRISERAAADPLESRGVLVAGIGFEPMTFRSSCLLGPKDRSTNPVQRPAPRTNDLSAIPPRAANWPGSSRRRPLDFRHRAAGAALQVQSRSRIENSVELCLAPRPYAYRSFDLSQGPGAGYNEAVAGEGPGRRHHDVRMSKAEKQGQKCQETQ
jgi:hypothetical protein